MTKYDMQYNHNKLTFSFLLRGTYKSSHNNLFQLFNDGKALDRHSTNPYTYGNGGRANTSLERNME